MRKMTDEQIKLAKFLLYSRSETVFVHFPKSLHQFQPRARGLLGLTQPELKRPRHSLL